MTAATRRDYERVVQILLEAGADINVREITTFNSGPCVTSDTQAPLEASAAVGLTDMIRFLLDSGADINAAKGERIMERDGPDEANNEGTTGLRAFTLAAERRLYWSVEIAE